MANDLIPLPLWRQRWRAAAGRREKHLLAFKAMVGTLLSLAVSCAGATLVAYGVWSVYQPAGYVVAGALVWALQWSHEKDREVGR
jgi:hypothetical protein